LFVLSQLNTADRARFRACKPLALMLYGAPGSGKGTLGTMLSRVTAWPHLSTGVLLREQITKGTHAGEASKAILQGSFAPDSVVNALVADWLTRPEFAHGVIIDGYPRNLAQAVSFLPVLDRMNLEPIVVRLVLDYTEIGERLRSRVHCLLCGVTFNLMSQPPRDSGRCDECGSKLVTRPDDSPEYLDKRLADYHSVTGPVETLLRTQKRKCWEFNSHQPPESLLNQVLTELSTSSLIEAQFPES
jgi:adenylate kinase